MENRGRRGLTVSSRRIFGIYKYVQTQVEDLSAFSRLAALRRQAEESVEGKGGKEKKDFTMQA